MLGWINGERNCQSNSFLNPVYGIAWNGMMLTRCDTKRINDILVRLRNSPNPRPQYGRLVSVWLNAYFSTDSVPAEMAWWGILSGRFRLELTSGR